MQQKKLRKIHCINPTCSRPNQRVFQIQDEIETSSSVFGHQKCIKWLVYPQELAIVKQSYRSSNQSQCLKQSQHQGQQLSLSIQQIQPLKISFNRKIFSKLQQFNDQKMRQTKQLLAIRMLSIRRYFDQKIIKLQKRIQQKISFIFSVKELFKNVENLVKNDLIETETKSHRLNMQFASADAHLVKSITQLDEFQIFDWQNIFDKINTAQKIFQVQNLGFYKEKLTNIEGNSKHRKQQLRERQKLRISNVFEQYIQQQCENPLGKIQHLATQLGCKTPNFETNQQQQTISLRCYLCKVQQKKRITAANKKNTKKQIIKAMSAHLTSQHALQNGLAYQRLIKKSQIRQITYVQAMRQLCQTEGQIRILDRQSGITYVEDSMSVFQGNFFILQLVSSKNVKLAKQKYLKAQKREHLDILAVILAFELSRMGKSFKFQSNSSNIRHLQDFFAQNINKFAWQNQDVKQQEEPYEQIYQCKYQVKKEHNIQNSQEEFSRKYPSKRIKKQQ